FKKAETFFSRASLKEDSEEAIKGEKVASLIVKAESAFDEGKWETVIVVTDDINIKDINDKAKKNVLLNLNELKSKAEDLKEEEIKLKDSIVKATVYREEKLYDKALETYNAVNLKTDKNKKIQSLKEQVLKEKKDTEKEKQDYLAEKQNSKTQESTL